MILDVSLNLIIEPFLSKNIKFSLSKTSSGLKFSKYLILEKLYGKKTTIQKKKKNYYLFLIFL